MKIESPEGLREYGIESGKDLVDLMSKVTENLIIYLPLIIPVYNKLLHADFDLSQRYRSGNRTDTSTYQPLMSTKRSRSLSGDPKGRSTNIGCHCYPAYSPRRRGSCCLR